MRYLRRFLRWLFPRACEHEWSKWAPRAAVIHMLDGRSVEATRQVRQCGKCGWMQSRGW